MFKVTYVLLIMIPSYGKYEVIAAEPRISFRQCMVSAQHHNDKIAGKSFAVCMPTIREKSSQGLPKKIRRHISR